MSLGIRCVVCDARLPNPYAPRTHCERCQQPCETCDGAVQNCQHPLPADRADLEPKELPNGRFQVAA